MTALINFILRPPFSATISPFQGFKPITQYNTKPCHGTNEPMAYFTLFHDWNQILKNIGMTVIKHDVTLLEFDSQNICVLVPHETIRLLL